MVVCETGMLHCNGVGVAGWSFALWWTKTTTYQFAGELTAAKNAEAQYVNYDYDFVLPGTASSSMWSAI